MTPLETLRVAVYALLRNKLRSFLTTLGMIIGVSALRPASQRVQSRSRSLRAEKE